MDDKITKNGMGGAYGTYGGEQKFIQGLSGETWEPWPRSRWEENIRRWDVEIRTGMNWVRTRAVGGWCWMR